MQNTKLCQSLWPVAPQRSRRPWPRLRPDVPPRDGWPVAWLPAQTLHRRLPIDRDGDACGIAAIPQ